MLDTLKKHHIGIIVDKKSISDLEVKFNKKFHKDETQGVQVLFIEDQELGMYREYISNEGRASAYDLGLHHICYNVKNITEFNELKTYLKEHKLGFRLTFPEKSGSSECNYICFYMLKGIGVIEFNILDYNEKNK